MPDESDFEECPNCGKPYYTDSWSGGRCDNCGHFDNAIDSDNDGCDCESCEVNR